MKANVTQWEFEDRFKQSDTYKNNFTHSALKALYEYLTNIEDDIGEEIEFDMIALCCEYSEYKSAFEAASEYGYNVDQLDAEVMEGEEELEKNATEWLEDRTQVIPFDGTITLTDGTVLGNKGIIIQQF